MVVLIAMPTGDDHEPTIEVSAITLLDLLEFMGDLGPSPGVTLGSSGGSSKRRRRKVMGLSLAQLAERALQAPYYIGTIEHGRRAPSLSETMALAQELGVAPGELFGLRPDLSQAAEGLFESVPRDVQDAVVRVLRNASLRRKARAGRPAGLRGNDGGDRPGE